MLRSCVFLALVLGLVACAKAPETATDAAPNPVVAGLPKGDPVEGQRIASRVGCNGCHEKDGRGSVFQDIPGVARAVAANLTEKRAFYDDVAFRALLREGKTHDGHRPLGMPILMFQRLSDQDIADITAWVRSLPAVANPGLPAPWLSDATKKSLADGTFPYDDDVPVPGIVAPAVRPTEPKALGEYLAMTSCPECHGRDLTGWGPEDETPSLVLVAKAYSNETFARLMKTGITASGKESKSGMMTGIARGRTATMTDAEIAALKLYLDSR